MNHIPINEESVLLILQDAENTDFPYIEPYTHQQTPDPIHTIKKDPGSFFILF